MIVKEPEGSNFTPAPAGMHRAVCVDVIDKGLQDTPWGQKHKVMLRWQIDALINDPGSEYHGQPYLVSKMYTASLHEKANLRHDLENWRSRAFNDQELGGFDLESLIGVNCQVNILHKPSKNGDRVYANITAITPPVKGVSPLVPQSYVRDKDRDGASSPDPTPDYNPEDDDIPF